MDYEYDCCTKDPDRGNTSRSCRNYYHTILKLPTTFYLFNWIQRKFKVKFVVFSLFRLMPHKSWSVPLFSVPQTTVFNHFIIIVSHSSPKTNEVYYEISPFWILYDHSHMKTINGMDLEYIRKNLRSLPIYDHLKIKLLSKPEVSEVRIFFSPHTKIFFSIFFTIPLKIFNCETAKKQFLL